MFILTKTTQSTSNQWKDTNVCVSKDVELLKLKVYNLTSKSNWDGSILKVSNFEFYKIEVIGEC